MKASQFNILVTPDETPTQAILFNTFHDHRLLIENQDQFLQKFFEKIKNAESLDEDEQELAQNFYELGILIDDDADERAMFDHWYDQKIQNPKGILNLILVVSMACNLRCSYCYEKEQLDNKRNMTEESAQQFIAWVKHQIKTQPIEQLDMLFFGGEPLMNRHIVLMISEKLQEFCHLQGIEYMGKMVTNGQLMTPKVSKELRRVGIRKIKITLDGDKESHDTSRVTINGKGSFDQIWHNMERCNDDLGPEEEPIQLIIGGNFMDRTYDGFIPLLDRLATASFKSYISDINLKPVQEVSSIEMDNISSNPCDVLCYTEKNTSRMVRLREELVARDLPPIDGMNLGPCDFYRGDSYTVGLDGTLYPCIAFVDNKSCAIGHVEETKQLARHEDKKDEWQNAKPWTEECYECSFLPVCVGGCRATAYSNGFSWNSTVCEKAYFKRMSKAFAKELLGIKTVSEDTTSLTEFSEASLFEDAILATATDVHGQLTQPNQSFQSLVFQDDESNDSLNEADTSFLKSALF